jgi:hypothetical protein
VDDFIEYWSASRLLLAGENPYSNDELTLLQRSFTGSETLLIMWSLPWALSLLLPLGLLEYSASRWLWLILKPGVPAVFSPLVAPVWLVFYSVAA